MIKKIYKKKKKWNELMELLKDKGKMKKFLFKKRDVRCVKKGWKGKNR